MTGNATGKSRRVCRAKNTHVQSNHLAKAMEICKGFPPNEKKKNPGRKSGIPNGRDDLPAFGGHWESETAR